MLFPAIGVSHTSAFIHYINLTTPDLLCHFSNKRADRFCGGHMKHWPWPAPALTRGAK